MRNWEGNGQRNGKVKVERIIKENGNWNGDDEENKMKEIEK